jgi:hypothetical protein
MIWTKDSALIELKQLISEIDKLRKVVAFSAEHVRWQLNMNAFLLEIHTR